MVPGLPARGGGVGRVGQELPRTGFQIVEVVGEGGGRVEEFAVDVELPLVPGAVTHPHRAAVAPAREVGQFAFGQIPLPADAVHDLQLGTRAQPAGGRRREELEKLPCLVRACRHPQCLQGHAGVPDPCVPVVPVAGAAGHLGQRRGRGGHDRAGRIERQRLQDPSAGSDQVLPGTHVLLVHPRPAGPALQRVLQPPGDLPLAPELRVTLPTVPMVQGEPEDVTGAEDQSGTRGTAGKVEGNRGGECQHVGPAADQNALRGSGETGQDQPVLRPGRENDLNDDLPLEAGHLPQEGSGGSGTELVAPVSLAQHQGIGHRHGASGRGVGRLKHHGGPQVPPGRGMPVHRPDRPKARILAQHPAEDRRAVKTGEAQPVHGTTGAHERGGAAIREHAVVGNRFTCHRDTLPCPCSATMPRAPGSDSDIHG